MGETFSELSELEGELNTSLRLAQNMQMCHSSNPEEIGPRRSKQCFSSSHFAQPYWRQTRKEYIIEKVSSVQVLYQIVFLNW